MTVNHEHSNQNMDWGSEVYCYKAAYIVARQWLIILHSDWLYIRIFFNDKELVNGYFMSTSGNSLSLAYDFQRHIKQEMTQIKLVLQNELT